tara:strand:+ start:184 stop:753 length:570 start_codon:yes stop_codon:yes gene_type:complete
MAKNIAIDMDEVICPFIIPLSRFARKTLPPPKEKYRYNYSEVFGITPTESQILVCNFYKSREFRDICPYPWTMTALKDLKSEGYNVHIITGRQEYATTGTMEFVDKWLSEWVDSVHLTNSFSMSGREIPKHEVMKQLNIGLIIDDNIEICRNCQTHGLKSIYINEKPWSEDWDGDVAEDLLKACEYISI